MKYIGCLEIYRRKIKNIDGKRAVKAVKLEEQ